MEEIKGRERNVIKKNKVMALMFHIFIVEN